MKRHPVEIVHLSVPFDRQREYRRAGFNVAPHDGHHRGRGLIASKPVKAKRKKRGKR